MAKGGAGAIVIREAIAYAERAVLRESDAAKKSSAVVSWHTGRAGAYEDMAGMLRLGLAAALEADEGKSHGSE